MARKVTISKEMILETALKMLIRDGYQSINIKSLAAEIGCSTQPIAWHFENMDAMRRELAVYAKEYAESKIKIESVNPSDTFFSMGQAYISLAINEPKLFTYLYLGERPIDTPFTPETLSEKSGSHDFLAGIAAQTGLSEAQAAECIRNTVIYSHGLATMIATGVLKISESEAMEMISGVSKTFLKASRRKEE